MPYRFDRLTLTHPDLAEHGEAMRRRLATLTRVEVPRLRRLWSYYRNPASPQTSANDTSRPYRLAQEWGLPERIAGPSVGGTAASPAARKEIVIENDVAWRIDAMIDFLFGRPVTIRSAAADAARRERIDRLLDAVFAANGGIAFLQRIALLGAVYGHVDVLVKYVAPADAADVEPEADDAALAARVRFEIVEPTRAVPLVSATDPTTAAAYAQAFELPRAATAAAPADRGSSTASLGWLDALRQSMRPAGRNDRADAPRGQGATVQVLEVITPTQWQRYEDERLVAEGANALGRVPLVHVQNAAIPFEYAGAGEVEALMPMQDELNTRLSDRAYRISMQSARMYLGKNIDGFADLPIGPGRMYATDNADASIVEFGGDAACPSEADHIGEVREALDKVSGVSPVAAGAIRGRIGNLTSAAALRVTLTAMLGRTERKRSSYGPAIARLCELSLAWLDRAGAFATSPAERRVTLEWPEPLPLANAR